MRFVAFAVASLQPSNAHLDLPHVNIDRALFENVHFLPCVPLLTNELVIGEGLLLELLDEQGLDVSRVVVEHKVLEGCCHGAGSGVRFSTEGRGVVVDWGVVVDMVQDEISHLRIVDLGEGGGAKKRSDKQ